LAVKLNIGAPMSQGVVEVKRIREYIRAHGGYQVDPVASPNWVLMPDGSTRSARRHEVAIYTFLVPQNEGKRSPIISNKKVIMCSTCFQTSESLKT
jgi:hypothetical protein